MIDHIGIEVSDYKKSVNFYKQALEPLGYRLLMEVEGFAGFGPKVGGGTIANFWIHQGKNPSKVHIAFTALHRNGVDTFYQSAINAGGKDNGKPGVREIYHPSYYGAFVFDPDGNNVEAVCHSEENN